MSGLDEYMAFLWDRALVTLDAARDTLSKYPDTAANRAYYSAFYAVSALLASQGLTFKKHTGVRSAVHKELVHTGRWAESLGDDYDALMELRDVADYGAFKRVNRDQAVNAVESAERIVRAVHEEKPGLLKN